MGLKKFFSKIQLTKKHGNGGKKRKKRFSRVPRRSSRAFKKRYPLILALHISECVPSSISDDMKKYASSKDDGAVQDINGNYPVIVASESALEDAGLTTKSPDLGELSSSVQQNIMLSATMSGDLKAGRLVLIPTQHTLLSIDSYKELSKVKYQWGLFKPGYSDNASDNTVTLLDNKVTLPTLKKISKNNLNLSVTNNKMVAEQKSSNNPFSGEQKPSESSTSHNGRPSGPTPQGPTVAPNQTKPDDSQADQDLTDFFGGGSQSSSNEEPKQTPFAESSNSANAAPTQKDPFTSDSTAPVTSGTSNENPFVDDTQNQSSNSIGDSNKTNPFPTNDADGSTSSNASNEDPFADNTTDSDSSAPSGADANDIFAQASSAAGMGFKTHGNTRKKRFNEHPVTKPTQSPATFANDMTKLMQNSFYDSDLKLKIDLTDVKYLIKRAAPLQFTIKNHPKGDDLGKVLNQKRNELNKNLLNVHKQHVNDVFDGVSNYVNETLVGLEKGLDPNEKGTKAYTKTQSNSSKYSAAKAQLRPFFAKKDSGMDSAYNSQKSIAVSKAASSAADSFDSENKDQLARQKRAFHSRQKGIVRHDYLKGKADIKTWRYARAKRIISMILPGIVESARKQLKSYSNNENKLYNKYEQILENLALNKYNAEVVRCESIAKAKDHDHKIVDLRRDKRTMRDNYNRRIKQIRNDAHQHMLEKTQHTRDVNKELRQRNKELQKRNGSIRDDVTKEFEHQLKVKDDNYNTLKKDNEAKLARQQDHFDKQNNNTTKQLNDIKSQMTHSKWFYLVCGIVAVVICSAAGYIAGSKSSSHNNSPRVRVESNADEPSSGSASSASASSAPSNSTSSSASHPKVSSGLMTTRPHDKSGYYIATSLKHKPTDYFYVTARAVYKDNQAVTGIMNGKRMDLTIVRTKGNQIFVKNPKNDRTYEFNVN